MAQKTRVELEAMILANIRSEGILTRAVDLREVLDALVESFSCILDDYNANNGFFGIGSAGEVDVTKIADTSPVGKFLKDNGTWSAIVPRVTSQATPAAPTPDTSLYDQYNILALVNGAVFGAPTGGAVDGQPLIIRVTSVAAQTLSFNAAYRFQRFPAPTTTSAGRTSYLVFKYNSADGVWDCIHSTFFISEPAITAGPGAGSGSASYAGGIFGGLLTVVVSGSPTTNSIIATATNPNSFAFPLGCSVTFEPADAVSATAAFIRFGVGAVNGWTLRCGATGLAAGTYKFYVNVTPY